jgi:hypothetical protein
MAEDSTQDEIGEAWNSDGLQFLGDLSDASDVPYGSRMHSHVPSIIGIQGTRDFDLSIVVILDERFQLVTTHRGKMDPELFSALQGAPFHPGWAQSVILEAQTENSTNTDLFSMQAPSFRDRLFDGQGRRFH